DKCRRLIAAFFERFCPGRTLGYERSRKIGHAMAAGHKASQNTGMRAIRNGTRCEGLREPDPVPRQVIESWSLNVLVPISVNMVSAKSVDRDQVHIRSLLPASPYLSGSDVGHGQRAQCQDGKGTHAAQTSMIAASDK